MQTNAMRDVAIVKTMLGSKVLLSVSRGRNDLGRLVWDFIVARMSVVATDRRSL